MENKGKLSKAERRALKAEQERLAKRNKYIRNGFLAIAATATIVAGIIAFNGQEAPSQNRVTTTETIPISNEYEMSTEYGSITFEVPEGTPQIEISEKASDVILGMVADTLQENNIEPNSAMNNVVLSFAEGPFNANNQPNLAPANTDDIRDMTVGFNPTEIFATVPFLWARAIEENPDPAVLEYLNEGYARYGITPDLIRQHGIGNINAAFVNMAYAQEVLEGAWQRGLATGARYDELGNLADFEETTDDFSEALTIEVFNRTLRGEIPVVMTLSDGGVINSSRLERWLLESNSSLSPSVVGQYVSRIETADINR